MTSNLMSSFNIASNRFCFPNPKRMIGISFSYPFISFLPLGVIKPILTIAPTPLSACRQTALLTMTLTSMMTASPTSQRQGASTACTALTAATPPTTKTRTRKAGPTPTRSWTRPWTMRLACPVSRPSRAHLSLSGKTRRSSRTQQGTRAFSML